LLYCSYLLSMARKQAHKKETTMVPHRTPNLSALLERAKTGNSAADVEAYLDAGGAADVCVHQKIGQHQLQLPLLHSMALASAHPHRELAESVRLLVEAGADINAKRAGPDGDLTPLMYAAKRICCKAVLNVFLQAGADPFVSASPTCTTALHIAAQIGLAETCGLLVTQADTLLEARDDKGWTPLMHAAVKGRIDSVQLLLQHGADIDAVDADRRTALFIASNHKQLRVAACLLNAGADVHVADSVDTVQLLLQHGADIQYTAGGQNTLFTATNQGNTFMMELLVQRGLCVHVHVADNAGATLLMLAACRGHKHAAEWLLQHGAAVDAADNTGYAALHFASKSSDSDNPAMIELLQANGADVNKRADDGTTALFMAAKHGNIQCATALIAAGAHVVDADIEELSALHAAILSNHIAVVQLLLEHGATAMINSMVSGACDNGEDCCDGVTALMMCEHPAITKVLLAAGADVHAN
jgi:uncharacterized protein